MTPKQLEYEGAQPVPRRRRPGSRIRRRDLASVAGVQSDGFPISPGAGGDGGSRNAGGTLVAGQDGVEAAWAVVQPILMLETPVHDYEPGTWGPPEAQRLTAGICGCHSSVCLLPHG